MKTAFEEIKSIAEWWKDLRPDFNGLNELLHYSQRVSAFMLTMGDDLATARKTWGTAKGLYEKEKNQARVKFANNKGTSATQADYQARANTAKLYEVEAEAEAMYFAIKHQYDAVVELLETMRQRIAVLRREWELKNYAG